MIWPARSAARWLASQALRVCAGSAANRSAAGCAGVPRIRPPKSLRPGPPGAPSFRLAWRFGSALTRPRIMVSAAATAFCAWDAPGSAPMKFATMLGPSVHLTWLAVCAVVSVGPSIWTGSSRW